MQKRGGKEEGWRRGKEDKEESRRRSKDEVVNREGRILCRCLEEQGWSILNGDVKGDEEGELTYTGGRGESVIDYVIGDERTREEVRRVVVKEKVDSDHHPVVVWVRKGREDRIRRRGCGRGRGGRLIWTEERRKEFKKLFGKKGGQRIEDSWGKLKGRVGEVLEKMGKKEHKGGWWMRNAGREKRG